VDLQKIGHNGDKRQKEAELIREVQRSRQTTKREQIRETVRKTANREMQFYASMSRARWAMHVFTDSKVALRDAVTRPSKRLSSWEVADATEKHRTLKAELDRQRAKERMEQQEKSYER
jgi:hypothetical protein